ncbi:MAG: beta-ketoacyl synthase N-terminal-like domain-containing protein [Peptococcaceae bacterium]|jgi:acyl transferase domain-containing protein/NAD(P)-dependent dehydrogenase (short-subunit alcohol dehydrogenase family)/acyl carrier protein|nr:KR domain-containing protein [Peptococcaceae bacterium]MDH7526004.1 beta-ketoacyl synthase N-terminal-like domain-containing protein [Peptococcaceae bacterium]
MKVNAGKTEERINGQGTAGEKGIAVVGLSLRFPKSDTLEEFWGHLEAGECLVTEVPPDRWNKGKYYGDPRREANKTNSVWGGFIEGADCFDASFFQISPREAVFMDPQQRIVLELAWKAIEDAGYRAGSLKGSKTGVFIGVCNTDYTEMIEKHIEEIDAYIPTGTSYSILANRISYWFDFKGPSITVDTACAGSLVAVHQAASALLNKECEWALAGGVNLCWSPRRFIALSQSGMLSKDGKSKAFDEKADGYVRGEGGALLVLKPLSRAVEDKDHIYAVIRGTGTNHGGRTSSLTVTNPMAQADLIAEVYEKAGIAPDTVSYVETHGPGTPLGDPIEILGLKTAFKNLERKFGLQLKESTCGLGSVKTNIGHLESAAGVAGVIKVIASMKYRTLPASLHFNRLNPVIDLAGSPFYIVSEKRPWETKKDNGVCLYPRRAGVSSFGFGGSNAHVVLEEYLPGESTGHREQGTEFEGTPALVPLSAQNTDRLLEYARKLLDFLLRQAGKQEVTLAELAFTLQVGREAMKERVIFLAKDIPDLIRRLGAFIGEEQEIVNCWRGQAGQDNQIINFLNEEDYQELVNKWILKKEYKKIAEMWARGASFDWELLYGNSKPRRISLPTYPFARERYWIPMTKNDSDSGKKINDAGLTAQRRECFLYKHWESCPAKPAGECRRTVAIITTEETSGLAVKLAGRFSRSAIIRDGELASLLHQPAEKWKEYDGVIDITGCGRRINQSLDWLFWLQRLIDEGRQEGLTALCVTKGLESFQNNAVNLSGAVRAGLYRMLQSEYAHVRSRHLDVDPHAGEAATAEQVAAEYLAGSEEAETCFRQGERYRACLQELQEQAEEKPEQALAFPQDHVLLVTGGTRGLGLLCARHFMEKHGVKRLVLMGQKPLPPREQWDLYRDDNSLAFKIQAVRDLEEHGALVRVLAVSLPDEDGLKMCRHEIKTTMGPVGGIIHCAGSLDLENPAFVRKTPEAFRQVFSPKVDGLDALYRVFQKEPLRFFVLFSSVSAAVPSLASGLSDYAMANAYLDYFAQAHAEECPIVSIQWPSWKESGRGEVKNRAYQQTGLLSHTDAEGLRLLDRVVCGKLGPVILPAVVNPDAWMPERLMSRPIRETPDEGSYRCFNSGEEQKIAGGLAEETQKWLTGLFAGELKIDQAKLEAGKPFQEYGVDSIMLAQVITRMEKELGSISLEPSALLEHPTIKSLACYLTGEHPAALASLFSAGSSSAGTAARQEESGKIRKKGGKEKIAVVGLACHFPEAADAAVFWENLKSGRDSMREVPKSRWDWEKYYYSGDYREGKSISKWGAFLEGIEEFDPGYFRIAESLAPHIDPLQRQWLEVCAEALADAGFEQDRLWGKKVGVFVGARTANFSYKYQGFNKDRIVGTGQNFIAAHLAHVFNFKGPNMVIDTACSSSLTAVHLAVRSIQNEEAEIALAGGVEILLDETFYLVLSAARILSPEGRCKTFDAGANGIGIGEGCAAMVLKPLTKAVMDNDKIYGVIDGSAVNNDGHTMGITTPNPEAQQELIEAAIDDAQVAPETISYIEAHGTGTLIGDPIELKGLTRAFARYTAKKQFCGVGSVKSNIGHLLNAAGAASLVKVFLAIIHRKIPPTLHCNSPNPRFNFDDSPFYLVRELKEWTTENGVLRAGISAFGLGGNNAHIIVSNEGVPSTHTASLEPKGHKIEFKRKRYWPDVSNGQGQKEEEQDFLALFEQSRVEMESENTW